MSYPSNPFGPPGHQSQRQPEYPPQLPPQDLPDNPSQSPQAWAPVQQTGYAAQGQAPWPASGQYQPFSSAPKGGNGLAVTAIVLSGLALLGVLAMAAFVFVGPIMGGAGYALSGEVTVVDKGASYSDLQEALVTAIEDDGGSVDEIVCPERSQVGQGLVTVCHGSVDGFDWTGIVVFEDDEGSFVLTEY